MESGGQSLIDAVAEVGTVQYRYMGNIEPGTSRQGDDLNRASLPPAEGFDAMNAIEQRRRPIVIMPHGTGTRRAKPSRNVSRLKRSARCRALAAICSRRLSSCARRVVYSR